MRKKWKRWFENFVVKLRQTMELKHLGDIAQMLVVSAMAALQASNWVALIPAVLALVICSYLLWKTLCEMIWGERHSASAKPPTFVPQPPRPGGQTPPRGGARSRRLSRRTIARRREPERTKGRKRANSVSYTTTVIFMHVG